MQSYSFSRTFLLSFAGSVAFFHSQAETRCSPVCMPKNYINELRTGEIAKAHMSLWTWATFAATAAVLPCTFVCIFIFRQPFSFQSCICCTSCHNLQCVRVCVCIRYCYKFMAIVFLTCIVCLPLPLHPRLLMGWFEDAFNFQKYRYALAFKRNVEVLQMKHRPNPFLIDKFCGCLFHR